MTPVQVGQVWLVQLGQAGVMREFRIDRIDRDPTEPRAHGVLTESGKPHSATVRCLARSYRRSRLVRHADGSELFVAPAAPIKPADPLVERRVASDLVRLVKPRGVIHVDDRARAIAALRADGVSPRDIGERFGIRPDSVSSICKRVRDATMDAALERGTE